MPNFQKYSAYYDLLYADKDYEAEADYVVGQLRAAMPSARTILELGSGTGRHGRLLAKRGFDVHGVERSADMVEISDAAGPQSGPCQFTCQVGDICDLSLGRRFDAVISLFHVISYQTSNEALQGAFRTAADHLKPGGVFLFDVWHGPAVLTERPSRRVREVAGDGIRVKRTASPTLDTNRSTVEVVFDMECENLSAGGTSCFSETHLMRYLFSTEIDFLSETCGLRRVKSEEFLTGREPSTATWGVMYLLRK